MTEQQHAQPEQKKEEPKLKHYDPVTNKEVSELPPEQYAIHSREGHLYGPFSDAEAARKFARAASHEGPPWTVVGLAPPLLRKPPDPVVVTPPEPTVVLASNPTPQPAVGNVTQPPHPPPLAHPHS